MNIIIDVEQKDFFEKLEKLPKIVKIKRQANQRMFRGQRIEYVAFLDKEIEKKKLFARFVMLENRQKLAICCFEEIKKSCQFDNSVFNMAKVKDLLKPELIDSKVVINVEYLIFAINSCLDSMAHILNHLYDLRIKERYVSFYGVCNNRKVTRKRDIYTRFLRREFKSWIHELIIIRNKMMHHQIVGFSSQVMHNVAERKTTYSKFNISVIDDKGKEIIKKLPDYLQEILNKYSHFKGEFYKKIDSLI